MKGLWGNNTKMLTYCSLNSVPFQHMKATFITGLICLSLFSKAQLLDSSSFDFWVGEWELSWTDSKGIEHHGVNIIEKVWPSGLIQENFYDSTAGYFGKSWSSWSDSDKTWRQLWVDNQQAWLDFKAQLFGDTLAFILIGDGSSISPLPHKRMLFRDISSDNFVWEWQSKSAGEAWKTSWKIFYQRKKL